MRILLQLLDFYFSKEFYNILLDKMDKCVLDKAQTGMFMTSWTNWLTNESIENWRELLVLVQGFAKHLRIVPFSRTFCGGKNVL